jgi:hypothetical protein
LPIDEQLAVRTADPVAGDSNDPVDPHRQNLAGSVSPIHGQVAPMQVPVTLVDQDAVAWSKGRFVGSARNVIGLV